MKVSKATRKRLAKSEVWLWLAATAQRWSDEVADKSPHTKPFAQWENGGQPDPFHQLCRTYGLTQLELSRLVESVAELAESQAMRTGYEDHWDEGTYDPS